MEIIEFDYDYDIYFDDFELTNAGVKYFEKNRGVSLYEILEFIVDFYETTGLKGARNVEEALLKGLDTLPEDVEKEVIEEIEEWTEEKFESVTKLVKDGYYGEVLDYIHYNMETNRLEEWLEDGLLPSNNFHSGIVGYSQWAYFIAHETTDTDYIRSIWEGTDFYVISRLDDRGDILDSVGWYYAPDVETLLSYATDIALTDDFVVVDNEVSHYMKDVTKVEKVRHVEYTFQEIE